LQVSLPKNPQPHVPAAVQQGPSSGGHERHSEATHAQAPLSQTRPPVHAYADPQPPQLLRSVCSFTQAPLQGL
jgi:hypothetical protein